MGLDGADLVKFVRKQQKLKPEERVIESDRKKEEKNKKRKKKR